MLATNGEPTVVPVPNAIVLDTRVADSANVGGLAIVIVP